MPLPGQDELFAGFGRSDITPAENFPNGIWMAQRHLRATGIHRRLYVSCVIFGCGADAVALLSYDLTILSAKQVAAIRVAIQSRTGLPVDRIWLYVTHNHAAPVTRTFTTAKVLTKYGSTSAPCRKRAPTPRNRRGAAAAQRASAAARAIVK